MAPDCVDEIRRDFTDHISELEIGGALQPRDPTSADSPQSGHARQTVKVTIERQDLLDPVPPHDGEVNGIPSREIRVTDHDVPGTLDNLEVHRQHLVDKLEQDLEARLDGVASVNRHVSVEDFLEDLGVGDQPSSLGDGPLEKAPRIDLVRVLRAHQVHRNVGVDQDHSPLAPYPRSISPSI